MSVHLRVIYQQNLGAKAVAQTPLKKMGILSLLSAAGASSLVLMEAWAVGSAGQILLGVHTALSTVGAWSVMRCHEC